jgi:hypothetical protein
MFQEALAMPGPVLNQASPAPSQAITDTTSTTAYSVQGQGTISFSQVGNLACVPVSLLNHTHANHQRLASVQDFFPHEVTLFRTAAIT